MSSDLLRELLSTPVGRAPRQETSSPVLSKRLEVRGPKATVTLNTPAGASGGQFADVLRAEGLDPDEWEVVGLRTSEWTMPNGEVGVSRRYTLARRAPSQLNVPVDELVEAVRQWEPENVVDGSGEYGYLVLLGDNQFGKMDGDGTEGSLRRTITCLDRAAELLAVYRQRFDIGHVHVAWLGDHVEGFVSQGGGTAWRTELTLTEQVRLTRRVMLHALLRFAPLAKRVTMAAIPGNHGETVRFGKTGITRYDDSHDTEALVAVADAAAMEPDKFGHVEFYVPGRDELVVTVEVAGTVVGHAHGHQWKPGKHWAWWRGQAFDPKNPLAQADLLVAGHLHHEVIESEGARTFIQVPSMESESTWWRHRQGSRGSPGLIVAVTRDGLTPVREVVYGQV